MDLRSTKAIIDLTAMRHNINEVRRVLPPLCNILVVVKANAYGLGAVKISKMLERNGVSYLGVAAAVEAHELRQNSINLPILMFTEATLEETFGLVNNTITQTVFSWEKAHELDIVAGSAGLVSRIHLKVDTGMGRIGCPYNDAFDIVLDIKRKLKHTILEGIYTHFPVAEDPDCPESREFTERQIAMFSELRDKLNAQGIAIPYYHCANTGGVINYPHSAFNMVRIGISAYGCHPSPKTTGLNLKSVLKFLTNVIFVKKVPAFTSISYGRHYITQKETTIATLPIGYADGYPLALSNKGKVLIRGKAYPVAGRVCMDSVMVDVGSDKVEVGDEAVLIGTQGEASFDLEEVSALLNTIPYEVICRIAPRVPRIHVGVESIDMS